MFWLILAWIMKVEIQFYSIQEQNMLEDNHSRVLELVLQSSRIPTLGWVFIESLSHPISTNKMKLVCVFIGVGKEPTLGCYYGNILYTSLSIQFITLQCHLVVEVKRNIPGYAEIIAAQLFGPCIWRLKRPGYNPWVVKIPWRRKSQPTPVFLLGESHGQRSLAGCSPWGHIEWDMTERLSMHRYLRWGLQRWHGGKESAC